jgi:hypothetical protein
MSKEFISQCDTPFVWDVEMKSKDGLVTKTASFKAIVSSEQRGIDLYKIVLEMVKQDNKDGFSYMCEFIETVDNQ